MNETAVTSESLAASWHRLAGPYHCRATRSAFFEGIANRYSEPHRFYHTLRHIGEMLGIIEEHRSRLVEYEAVAFAAWFHDLVFVPRGESNEERSGALAARIMHRLQIPSRIINRAVELIGMTASHQPTDHSFDTLLFLDADLSILGSSPQRYDQYNHDIRKEYAMVSDAEYAWGRSEALLTFLNRERIFLTDELFEREAQARLNMTAELESLMELAR